MAQNCLGCSRLRTQQSVSKDAGPIPGFSQWDKDLALLQAVAELADVAEIWCCHSCGVGSSCSFNLPPSPGTSIFCMKGKKEKKEKKKKKKIYPLSKFQGNPAICDNIDAQRGYYVK